MFDVIIVGGGIGGAVLANLLCRAKKRVLVLEKGFPASSSTRPEVLWPRTVEFLRSLIPPSPDWLLPLQGLQFWLGDRKLGGIGGSVFSDPKRQPTSSAPHETRRLLLEAAGCEVQHGYEVREVLRRGDAVVGVTTSRLSDGHEQHWESDLIVGDDGVHSVVREKCGFFLASKPVKLQLLSFGLPLPTGLEQATGQVWLNQNRSRSGIVLCGLIPLPAGRAAGLVAVRPRAFDRDVNAGLAEFATQNKHLADVLDGRAFPKDFINVGLQFGNSRQYIAPGVALMGDAAHPVTPAGGQGANLAIADARFLSDCLLQNGEPQLAQYEALRRKAANRSIRFSRGAGFAFSLPESSLTPSCRVRSGLRRVFRASSSSFSIRHRPRSDSTRVVRPARHTQWELPQRMRQLGKR